MATKKKTKPAPKEYVTDSSIPVKPSNKNGEKVDIEQSGLSKREWNELMLALELKDKLI